MAEVSSDFSTVMLVLFAIIVALAAFLLWERRHLYKLSWQLPGPFALPIIGNGLTVHPNRKYSFEFQLT